MFLSGQVLEEEMTEEPSGRICRCVERQGRPWKKRQGRPVADWGADEESGKLRKAEREGDPILELYSGKFVEFHELAQMGPRNGGEGQ